MAFQNIAVQLSANVGQFRQSMASAGAAVRTFAGEVNASSAAASRAGSSMRKSFEGVDLSTRNLSNRLGGLKGTLAGMAVTAGIGFGLKLAANLETSRVAFTGILGSAQEADAFIRDMQQFAARTPFTFVGVQKATQQLLALGQTGEQAIETLTTVGNAVSAVGGGEEQINMVVNALAQIQGRGKLSAQELNQIANSLPNLQRVQVYKTLGENLGITAQEAANLAEQGKITADEGIGAILEAMQNVPGAAGAMERQSRTLTGVLSTLKDQLTIAAGEGFGPLADAIRTTLYPMLNQLGGLLKDVMIPLGGGLADAFQGAADAFADLSPHLPGLADAMGSLASAFGSLLSAASGVLSGVLTPLVPALQALAGLLEGLLGIPGVTAALQALAVAFIAIKVQDLVSTMGFFASMLVRTAAQAVATTGVLGGLQKAAISLQASLGPVGLAIGALTAVMLIFKPTATDAEEATVDFTDALKKTGVEAELATGRLMAAKLAETELKGTGLSLVDVLQKTGLTMRDVKEAVEGYASGTAEGTKKSQDFYSSVTASMRAGAISEEAAGLLNNTIWDLGESLENTRQKLDDTAAAERALGIAGGEAAKSQEAIAKAVEDAFDPLTAYREAVDAGTEALERSSKARVDAIHKEYDARQDALERREDAEMRAYERETQNRKAALDARLDAEKDALEAENDARVAAMELRWRAEQEAFDDEADRRKDALDDTIRAEKHALDERLRNLKRSYDDRQDAMDEEFETQKEQLEFRIKYGFGADREAAIAELAALKERHKRETRELEDQQETEVNTIEDTAEDRWEAMKEGLDDELEAVKTSMTDRQNAEKTANQNMYDDMVAKFTARATAQKTALDNEVTDHKTHITTKYNDQKTHLTNMENDAVTAEQNRLTAAKASFVLSEGAYQTHLDNQTKKAKQYNADLALIAQRGGLDVMEAVAKLPPEFVNQIARMGPEAMDKMLESVRAAIGAGRDPLEALGLQPKQVAPGVFAIPKPGGGYYPVRASWADGGILRFADGGEHHVAQVAPPGAWRVWAEPETGGESYIPWALSKRARSTSVLAQTASGFGYQLVRMANGGILGGSSGGGGGGTSYIAQVQVDARVAAGVDMNYAARVIEERVRRGIDAAFSDLQRQVLVRAWRNG